MRSFPSRETGEDWEKGDALRRTTGSGGFSIEKLVSARLIINREICTKGLWRR